MNAPAKISASMVRPIADPRYSTRVDELALASAAATHCPHGHPRIPENTFASDSKTGRQKRCRTCHNIRNRARKERLRSAA